MGQHVLKDKRVFALVQKQAAEQEGMGSDQQWNVEDIVTYVRSLQSVGNLDVFTVCVTTTL